MYHVGRAHYCTNMWKNSMIATPELLDLVFNGIPVMTHRPATPKAVLELFNCGCKKECVLTKSSCRSNNVICSELCNCAEFCENVVSLLPVVMDDSDSDE
jgi:hypothetical protein